MPPTKQDCLDLWQKLDAHGWRDEQADLDTFHALLTERLQEADRMQQRERFLKRGASAFELLPVETLEIVIKCLRNAVGDENLIKYAGISKGCSRLIRPIYWETVERFSKKAPMTLTRQVAASAGRYVRSIGCITSSSPGIAFMAAASQLEQLHLRLSTPAQQLKFFKSASYNSSPLVPFWTELKVLSIKATAAHNTLIERGPFPNFVTVVSRWVRLTKITFEGVRAPRSVWRALLSEMRHMVDLDLLQLVNCRELSHADDGRTRELADDEADFGCLHVRRLCVVTEAWRGSLGVYLLALASRRVEEIELANMDLHVFPGFYGDLDIYLVDLDFPRLRSLRITPCLALSAILQAFSYPVLTEVLLGYRERDHSKWISPFSGRTDLPENYATALSNLRHMLPATIRLVVVPRLSMHGYGSKLYKLHHWDVEKLRAFRRRVVRELEALEEAAEKYEGLRLHLLKDVSRSWLSPSTDTWEKHDSDDEQ